MYNVVKFSGGINIHVLRLGFTVELYIVTGKDVKTFVDHKS